MAVVAVVPARGGSERVPNKNFRPLAGSSLLARATNLALEAGLRTVVSTDRAIEARALVDNQVQILSRPDEISGSGASMEDVIRHAATRLTLDKDDAILLLQPTSPLRSIESLRQFLGESEMAGVSTASAFSVTLDFGDYWIETSGGPLLRIRDRLAPEYAPRSSRVRLPLLKENGLFYITTVDLLMSNSTLVSSTSRPIVTPAEEDFDINDEGDWRRCEAILSQREGRDGLR